MKDRLTVFVHEHDLLFHLHGGDVAIKVVIRVHCKQCGVQSRIAVNLIFPAIIIIIIIITTTNVLVVVVITIIIIITVIIPTFLIINRPDITAPVDCA